MCTKAIDSVLLPTRQMLSTEFFGIYLFRLNSNLDLLITQKITVPISFNVPDYSKYRFLYFKIITDDSYSGDAFIVPRKLYNLFSKSVRIDATLSGPYYVQLSMLFATGTLRVERANFGTAWNNVTIQCYGIK